MAKRRGEQRDDGRPLRVGLQLGWRLEAGRQIIRGVLDFAEEHGGWEIHWDMMFDPRFPAFHRVDGLIALARQRDVARLQRLRVPVVLTAGSSRAARRPRVDFDNHAIGRMAARYLIDLGFETLGYFSHFPSQPDPREAGFCSTAAEAGVKVHVLRSTEPSHALELAKPNPKLPRWVRGLPKPIGVFAFNDIDALEVAQAARREGVRIPEDLALLGVDNDSVLHRLCRPPLSSIDHGAHQLGYRSAALLRDLLAGKRPPTAPVLVSPIGVVSRQSTDTLAVGDADVAMALRIIREEACDGLRAESVVRRVNISRTSLENRFRALLGRSVHQEIVRVRMEEAKHLLRVTDLPMPDITSRSGFRYPSQVSHLFRKHVGLSPREYRFRMRTTT